MYIRYTIWGGGGEEDFKRLLLSFLVPGGATRGHQWHSGGANGNCFVCSEGSCAIYYKHLDSLLDPTSFVDYSF